MSVLKFQLPIPPPRRADATLLPAALAALLGLLLVVQLALPSPVELPEVELTPPIRLRPLPVVPAVADPAIVARPIFAPGRREFVAPAGGAAADRAAPLEGARPVGVLTVRGAARVFLQAPDGRVEVVGRGGGYRGWTVTDIGSGRIAVRRGGERATLAVTASAPPRAATPDKPEDDPQ